MALHPYINREHLSLQPLLLHRLPLTPLPPLPLLSHEVVASWLSLLLLLPRLLSLSLPPMPPRQFHEISHWSVAYFGPEPAVMMMIMNTVSQWVNHLSQLARAFLSFIPSIYLSIYLSIHPLPSHNSKTHFFISSLSSQPFQLFSLFFRPAEKGHPNAIHHRPRKT